MEERIQSTAKTAVAILTCAVLTAGTALGAFTTHQLVLRQGEIPTLNGVPIAGASVYTGTADTYVFKDNPDTNYGTADTLHFFRSERIDNVNGQHATRAYVRFDNFTDYLPPGSTIIDSQIQVTAAGRTGAGAPLDVNYRTADWDASSLTFNTAGSWNANTVNMGGVNRNDSFADETQRNVDVSALTRAWAAGDIANHGLQFNAREGYSATYPDYMMYSSNHAIAGNRPALIIDYVAQERVQVGFLARERGVTVLQGPTVFEDTVIEQTETNYWEATTTGILQNRNSDAPPRPRRGLIKILTDHPEIAQLAATGDPITEGTTQLVGARLEFNIIGGENRGRLALATAAQDWDHTVATGLGGDSGHGFATADTEWNEAWEHDSLTNYETTFGAFAYDPAFQVGTQSFDITTILQAYIDGDDNFGFIMDGSANYGSIWALTGYSVGHMQPTLVLETVTFVVPEPATGLLALLGISVCVMHRRPRNK